MIIIKHITAARLLVCAAVAFLLIGCKTSEENYKAAYDLARAKAVENVGEEAYAKIEAEQTRYTAVVAGDSVRMLRKHVTLLDSPESAGRYGVVVREFKQRANARSLRDRLIGSGLDKAFVARSSEDDVYYVIAQGFDTPEEAADFLRNAREKISINLPAEKFWIIDKFR